MSATETQSGSSLDSLVGRLELMRLHAKEAEEWASMETDETVWSSAVQDIAALTRTIEIIKRKSANSDYPPNH